MWFGLSSSTSPTPLLPASRQTCSGVRFEPSTRQLTFSTTHLGTLALLAPRVRLLPYRSWNLRPTGGLGGGTVALTLHAAEMAQLPGPLVIEAGPAWARLVAPQLPELAGLVGRQLPSWQLLQGLADRGLNLLPDEIWDGEAAEDEGADGMAPLAAGQKHAAMDKAMCADIGRVR